MSNAPARDGEILSLTSIRGLAAWWVVLFHLRALLAPWFPAAAIAALGNGNLAVDLFFVLSGFVIHLTYGDRLTGGRQIDRREDDEGNDWRRIGDFLFRRFARIYPLHLLMLAGFAVYVGAAILFGSSSLADQDPLYFLASLLLVQNWGFFHALKWNVPAWSISTETMAYLLYPMLIRIAAPARRPAWLLGLAAILFGLAVPAWFAAFDFPFPDAVPQTGLARCLLQFAMGVLLCALYRRLDGRLAWPLLSGAALLAAGWAWFGWPVMPLVWAALVLGLALRRQAGLLCAPILVWLGRVSYATYLCHYLLLTLFKYAFVDEGKPAPLWLPALYLGAVLAASALLYHGFERPAQRGLLRWWKARRTPRQRAGVAEQAASL